MSQSLIPSFTCSYYDKVTEYCSVYGSANCINPETNEIICKSHFVSDKTNITELLDMVRGKPNLNKWINQ